MSRFFEQLRAALDDIEQANDWEYHFVTDMLEKKEQDPDHKFTPKQFNKLLEIHDRYCLRK